MYEFQACDRLDTERLRSRTLRFADRNLGFDHRVNRKRTERKSRATEHGENGERFDEHDSNGWNKHSLCALALIGLVMAQRAL